MASRDLFHSIAAASTIAPATVSSNTVQTGVSVDTFGYESLTLMAIIGGRTDGTYTYKVQDSADGSTDWQDLDPSAYMSGAAPVGLTAAGVILYGLKDSTVAAPTRQNIRRYVRAINTPTAVTTGGTGVGAEFILGHPHHRSPAV